MRLQLGARSQLESGIADSLTHFRAAARKQVKDSVLNLRLGTSDMARDVADKVVSLTSLLKHLPHSLGLSKVSVGGFPVEANGVSNPLLVLLIDLYSSLVGNGLVLGRIVGKRAVVAIDSHVSVSLVRVVSLERTVDRNLLVVDANSVAVGISI